MNNYNQEAEASIYNQLDGTVVYAKHTVTETELMKTTSSLFDTAWLLTTKWSEVAAKYGKELYFKPMEVTAEGDTVTLSFEGLLKDKAAARVSLNIIPVFNPHTLTVGKKCEGVK